MLTPPVQKDKSRIKGKCMNVNAGCAFQWSRNKLEIQNYLAETIKHENKFYPQAEVTINNWTLITECQSELNSGHFLFRTLHTIISYILETIQYPVIYHSFHGIIIWYNPCTMIPLWYIFKGLHSIFLSHFLYVVHLILHDYLWSKS